jgi:hemolysin III
MQKNSQPGAAPSVEGVGTLGVVARTHPPLDLPRLRGRLHQLAFLAAIPGGLTLIFLAHPARARVAACIYGVALMGLYGISSSYHRFARSPRARYWMQRLDHAMIYIFIAASYTPFGLLLVKGPWGIAILATVWAGAFVGVALKMLRLERTTTVGFVMYLALGWAMVAALPQMVRGLSGLDLGLLFTGGVLYTVGAVVLAVRRPDPVPKVFGYHEVWHTMVVAAAGCHYLIIRSLLAAAH